MKLEMHFNLKLKGFCTFVLVELWLVFGTSWAGGTSDGGDDDDGAGDGGGGVGFSDLVLDTSFPIVITEKREEVGAVSKSHFGYSVALAQNQFGNAKGSKDPDGWIFIGAPKADYANGSMYGSTSANKEPGVIWRCSLGRETKVGDYCEMVNVDPAPGRSKRPNAPRHESHGGAWIGASMEINYGRLLTCGMRWNRGVFQFYNGICYWFADTVGGAGKVSYRANDLTGLVDTSLYDQRLTTFFREDVDQDRLFSFVNSLNETVQGHEWQASQAGVSLHLFLDSGTVPNLLIGAPGVREWSGAVALYTNPLKPGREMERPNRRKDDPTFSEFLIGNWGTIPTKETSKRAHHWNEYFGYAVSAGKYLRKGEVLYAAGAPRADLSGEVVIFDFAPYQEGSGEGRYKRQVRPVVRIRAPKRLSFGSYFGSVLHTADLDGDGVDELIVGAPLYTFQSGGAAKERNEKIEEGKDEEGKGRPEKVKREKPSDTEDLGDHGCVFVYKLNGTKSEVSGEVTPLQFLVGSKAPTARFGSAISSIVFNLKNGTREVYLVIGAPYEPLEGSGGGESGAVYIYLFLKDQKKFSGVVQRIPASSFGMGLSGFGSSLSRPEDVDLNATPDIAIGSYKSGGAVVLRTRPQIVLKSWIKFFSFEGNEIQEVRRGVHQFYLKSCFSVAENLGLMDNTLDIWVKLRFNDKTINFHESHVSAREGNSRNEIIYMRTVDAHTSASCENLTIVAEHKDGIGMDDSDILKEIKHPFHFTQEVKYNETLDKPVTPFQYYALNQAGSKNTTTDFNSFGSRKPSPQMSKIGADLRISFTDCRDPVCRPKILMDWSWANEKGDPISAFVLGSAKEVTLKLNLSNEGESALKPVLILDWDMTSVKESDSGARWLHRSCLDTSGSRSSEFRCPLGLYIKKGRSIVVETKLNMENIFVGKPENHEFVANAKVVFEDTHISPFKSQTKLPLYVPATTVSFVGSREVDATLRSPFKYLADVHYVNSKRAQRTEDEDDPVEIELYSYIRQRFTIQVQGASVSKVTAHFKIPLYFENNENTNLQRPLILVKQPQVTHGEAFCEPVTPKFGFHLIRLKEGPQLTIPGVGIKHSSSFNFDLNHDFSLEDPSTKYLLLNPDSERQRVRRDLQNGENETDSISSRDDSESSSNVSGEIAIDEMTPKKVSKEERLELPEDSLRLFCESEGDCLEVKCVVNNLRGDLHVHIPFDIYPVKEEVDKLLKSQKKTGLMLETTGYAQIFHDDLLHLHQDKDVAQTILRKISGKEVQLWVYIVSGVSGVLLLALIIFALYKCGFFKREKRQQLNEMKENHKRKSMIAAARASMLLQSSASGGGGLGGGSIMGIVEGSLENLPEAEHRPHSHSTQDDADNDDGLRGVINYSSNRKSVRIQE